MGTSPTPVNGAATSISKIINFAILDLAVPVFLAFAKTEVPFLRLPVVSTLFDALIRWIGKGLFQAASQFATFTVIGIQTEAERSAYAKAEGALRHAHLSGDENELKKATADFKTALGNLVHFDGWTH